MALDEKLLTKEEAEKKWDNIPDDEKANLVKEFGFLAKPVWIHFATIYPLTEDGEKL